MIENDEKNPAAGVEALLDPHPLTLSQVAILSRTNNPVLYGKASDIEKGIEALYLTSVPAKDALRSIRAETLEEDSLAWADGEIGTDTQEYTRRMLSLLDGIIAFWKMLPPPGEKKTSGRATDGSSSSSNGPAAPTGGASGA